MKKVILFDLDGVLVDTTKIQIDATIEALSNDKYIIDNNINIKKKNDILNIINRTITTYDKLNMIKDKFYSEIDIDSIYDNKKIIANKLFTQFKIDNDKVKLFEYLKNKNIKIGIVTNSNKESATILLKQIGVYDMIDLLLANNDFINKKPHSEPYIRTMLYFRENLEDYLILEDSDDGITSAKNTGCDYIRVENYKDVNIELLSSMI